MVGHMFQFVAFSGLADGLAQAEASLAAPPAFLVGRQVAAAQLSGTMPFQVQKRRGWPRLAALGLPGRRSR